MIDWTELSPTELASCSSLRALQKNWSQVDYQEKTAQELDLLEYPLNDVSAAQKIWVGLMDFAEHMDDPEVDHVEKLLYIYE